MAYKVTPSDHTTISSAEESFLSNTSGEVLKGIAHTVFLKAYSSLRALQLNSKSTNLIFFS